MRILIRLVKGVVIIFVMLIVLLVAAVGLAWIIGPGNPERGEAVAPAIDCKPTPRHPNPVVVLPGGDGTVDETAEQWRTMTDTLGQDGYCTLVFQVRGTDGNRWASDIPSAGQDLAAFVESVKQKTSAQQVSIVGHSAGSVVANYYLKVLRGAPNVHDAVFIAPETANCDGAGFAESIGLPFAPFPVFRAVPAVPALLSRLAPSAAGSMQIAPGSEVFKSIFEDGSLTQPGVRYSVIASKHDQFATPAPTCSFIDEPGVTNALYDELFPTAPAVDHSEIRSSTNTAKWVAEQLSMG
ncbi:esterase/lipase family protein [Tsukamurella strandjordii]|uniref:Alpha/beta fold hydrolase n=1 Tax=Tsukamurella strandjordii TaxID=147577 RepID=A0AA90NS14_9ACTN|nr:alpha/beta fold hydrolase [Tsukamurella strandjordii]MDP0399754.1 alpha/beta fold hydrolase [Tsukamurella strandjordii]